MLIWLLTVGAMVCAIIAPVAFAQATPTLPQHDPPELARGTDHHSAFASGLVDDVNLANGNLTLALPLGPSFNGGGTLDYGFELRYNSQAWDYEWKCETDPGPDVPSNAGVSFQVYYPHPDQLSNAGMGWRLSFGDLLGPGADPIVNPEGGWLYVSPDGSRHAFFEKLHGDGARAGASTSVAYSNDASYLRLRQGAGIEWFIDLPNGHVHRFEPFQVGGKTEYRIVSISDPFGNVLAFDYTIANPNGDPGPNDVEIWKIDDARGRHHELHFYPRSGTTPPRLQTASLDIHHTESSVFTFDMSSTPLQDRLDFGHAAAATCPAVDAGQHPADAQVDLLDRITLPDGSYFEADYFTSTDDGSHAASGAIKQLRLPTGGGYEWNYQRYLFETWGRQVKPLTEVYGVYERIERPEGFGAGPANRWTYTPARSTAEASWDDPGYYTGGPSLPSIFAFQACFQTRTVEDPLGNQTVHYFQSAVHGFKREQLLPFTACHPETGVQFDVDGDGSSDVSIAAFPDDDGARPELMLSKRIYEGSVDTGTLVREEYVGYDLSPGSFDFNARLARTRTVFLDDGGSETTTRRSEFDALGNFARSRTTATGFPGINNWLQETDFDRPTLAPNTELAQPPISAGEPWILNTYRSVHEQQGADASPQRTDALTLFCFDDSTGFLEGYRRQRDYPSESSADVLVRYDLGTVGPDRGHVVGERYFGGDASPLGGSGCAEPGGSPEYNLRHEWAKGLRKRSWYADPVSGAELLSTLNLGITTSGLVAQSTDASDVTTFYTYDNLGRRTSERVDGLGKVRYAYQFPSGAGQAELEWWVCDGQADCSLGSSLQAGRQVFDGIGRPIVSERRMPGGQWASSEVSYNAAGWKIADEGWSFDGNGALTTYHDFDAFARPGRVVYPDSSERLMAYLGERQVLTTTWVDGLMSDRYEHHDARGRLIGLEEQIGPSSFLTTSYGYSERDELSRVCVADNNFGASNCQGQARRFDHDGRGFRVAELEPERDAIVGSSDTARFSFDSMGKVIAVDRAGTNTDLDFTYDRAGRLIRVEDSVGEAWEEYFFGYAGDTKGKLYQSKRRNLTASSYDDGAGQYRQRVTQVIETYGYDSQTGLLRSYRQRASVGAEHFAGQSPSHGGLQTRVSLGLRVLDYDSLGQPLRLEYSDCEQGDCRSSGLGTRTVDYSYSEGLVSGATDFLAATTYHADGRVAAMDHGNGLVTSKPLDHDKWRLRAIELSNSLGPVWTWGDFSYDGVGNITAIGGESYDYDQLSRLTRGTIAFERQDGSQGVAEQTASYDLFGNLAFLGADVPGGSVGAMVVDSASNRLTSFGSGATSGTATYNTEGQLVTLSNVSSTAATGEEMNYFYDPLGRMSEVMSEGGAHLAYIYTAQGERMGVLDVAGDTPGLVREEWSLRSTDGYVLRRVDRAGGDWRIAADYVRAGNIALGVHKQEGLRYFHHDHLGSTRRVSDDSGVIVERHDFLPFGGYPGGYAGYTPPDAERLRFTSHERDAFFGANFAAELDYMHARHYASYLGRFTSVDPAKHSAHLKSSQSWNRYTYSAPNPVGHFDPDGRAVETVWDAANVGIGAVSLAANVSDGKWGAALLDTVGLAYDVAATGVPILPAGASTGLKALRAGSRVAEYPTFLRFGTTMAEKSKGVYRMAIDSEKTIALGRFKDTRKAAVEEGYQILDLPKHEWSVHANDAFIQGIIDSGKSVKLVSSVEEGRRSGKVFQREIEQLEAAGYTFKDGWARPPE